MGCYPYDHATNIQDLKHQGLISINGMRKINKMRKYVETSSIELCDTKKIKVQKMPSYIANISNAITLRRRSRPVPRKKSVEVRLGTKRVVKKVDPHDHNLKVTIVEMALKKFLRGRRPINTLFCKYLGKFEKFGVYSLAYATALVEMSRISSKSDIRSFIYIFLAFNILSSKYLSDFSIWNHSYASDWGITLLQASQLEILALSNIDYNLEVRQEVIEKILTDGCCQQE